MEQPSSFQIGQAMNRREAIRLLAGGSITLAAGVFLEGCGGGGGGSNPTGTSNPFRVSTNSTDVRLATAHVSNGRVIEYYGTRNSQGIPTSVTQAVIRDSSNHSLIYQFNTTGRLTKMIAAGGTQISLNWLSPTTAVLTGITADGTGQVSTLIDTTKSSSTASRVRRRTGPQLTNLAPRQSRAATLTFGPLRKKMMPLSLLQEASPTGQVIVHVTQCGQSTSNADVYVLAYDSDTNVLLRQVPALPSGDGVFVAPLPENTAPEINVKEIAETLAETLGLTCDLFIEVPGLPQYFCVVLGAAVAVGTEGLGALAGAELSAGCLSVVEGLELYCKTLNTSAGLGSPSLADALANALPDDWKLQSPLGIQAEVIALPHNVLGQSTIVNGQGPFSLQVDLGSDSTIRTLTLDPPAPSALQGYVGTADVYCVPAQTEVVLSIVGTDGYSDSITYNEPTTMTDGTFTLTVPGAATAGIQDVVTLKVTLPDGTVLTRTASLVFG